MRTWKSIVAASLLITLSAAAQQTAGPSSSSTTPASQPTTSQTSQPAAPPSTMDQVVDRTIEREHALTDFLKTRTPLVETYLQNLKPDPQLGPVLVAALSIAAVTVTQIIAYRLLLAAYGPKLTWPQAATLSWVPGLAKYIPGKVVAIGGTVYLLRRYKIPAPVALSVTPSGRSAKAYAP